MVLEFAYHESLGYLKTLCNIFCYSKFHLDGFKLPDMTSKGELQISFPLYHCNKILLLTSCPVTLRANKSIKMKFFNNKIYCKVS